MQVLHDAEVVWQLPSQAPRALLFLAHGCNHGAIDFWPRSDACPTCTGLPEELNITRHALARGYAVVAVSSAARRSHRCWALPGLSGDEEHGGAPSDVERVRKVLLSLSQREGLLQGLPQYAMGASSGGAFVLVLAAALPLAGICSQVGGLDCLMRGKCAARTLLTRFAPASMPVTMTP